MRYSSAVPVCASRNAIARLTAAGERLLRDAKDILARSALATLNARRAARGELGLLRVGFTASASFNPFVTATIRDYREAYPEVRVELMEANTVQLLERFQARQLDVAFIRPAAGEADPLPCHLLQEEEMLVALPAGHPLSVNATSGYSGGGKAMIAEFEGAGATPTAFRAYALGLAHKHIAEMTQHAALTHAPIFAPAVANTYRGMVVEVPLHLHALPGRPTLAAVEDVLRVC